MLVVLYFASLYNTMLQLMQAAATHSPGNCDAQVVLGVLYNISQDFENAIECFRRAIDLSPPDYGLLNKVRNNLIVEDWIKFLLSLFY